MSDLYPRLEATAEAIGDATGVEAHSVVVVLGSGLGNYALRFAGAIRVPYSDLPGFPIPQAVGHQGAAFSVEMGRNQILLLAGRAHAYEGYSMETVTFPIRAAVLAGATKVVLTNAAGGCGDGIAPGDLVLITDHINMSGISPLAGENDERLGPRFPDMSDVYTPYLRRKAHSAAAAVGQVLREAVYFWWQGPMFETPAEVQMAKKLGAGLVGMSTVPEATAARHMGADVLGLSLCTNLAAGISEARLSAEEVIEAGERAAGRVGDLFDALLPSL
jgi:purine-nucleoside phosphorylase